jgi:hypothetical protein
MGRLRLCGTNVTEPAHKHLALLMCELSLLLLLLFQV